MSIKNLNYKTIIKIVGITLLVLGAGMSVPWIYSSVTGDAVLCDAFRKCAPVCLAAGLALIIFFRSHKIGFRTKDAYIIIALCWLLSCLAGAMPYYLSGFGSGFTDALFESAAGFTTTGSSVSAHALSGGLLLWKAVSSWLGGMAILMFFISVTPQIAVSSHFFNEAASSHALHGQITIRMKDSALTIFITYIVLTAAEAVLLALPGRMPVFDAFITSLGSVSTGGIMVHPSGIGFYDSIFIEIVISVFCLMASLNFVLYHYLFARKFSFINNIELKAFLLMIAAATAICTVSLAVVSDQSILSSLRESFFQVVSTGTTSGYIRNTSAVWPATCVFIFTVLMLTGGCTNSTSGSIKVFRVLVFFKLIARGFIKKLHPRAVTAVKIGRTPVSAPAVSRISAFLLMYMILLLLSSIVFSLQGLDPDASFRTALAMLSNTGSFVDTASVFPALSTFHPFIKLYMTALMIMGRLEIFAILILFTRTFWRKKD